MVKSTTKSPQVMIVGAGLSGLLLGLLLEKINVPYTIFERVDQVKPLGIVIDLIRYASVKRGSAVSLNACILPVFEQLGLLPEVLKLSLSGTGIDLYDGSLKRLGSYEMSNCEEVTGYPAIVFARRELHNMMLASIPSEKLLMNKKLVSFEEDDNEVMIQCDDGTTYHGDILVGADGAYSAVRRRLYKTLEQKVLLPKSDSESMALGYVTLVGTSDPLDPEKYPALKDPFARLAQVVGERHSSGNLVSASKSHRHGNSEWDPKSNESMVKEFYNCRTPLGGIIGHIFDATPKNEISKVYIEEKLFKTWHHGRTVLIGDGAVTAMQDAVILANCIYEMRELNQGNIHSAFQSYKEQRYAEAKAAYAHSRMAASLVNGQTWVQKLVRNIAFNHMPKWVRMKEFIRMSSYRPQASFLPLAEIRGTGYVQSQKPSQRYLDERAKMDPNSDKSAFTVAKTLLDIFLTVAFPPVIQSNNVKEFKTTVLTIMEEEMGVNHRFLAPYQPRGSGIAKRRAETAVESPRKLIKVQCLRRW
ncbi:hypothetical protein BGZ50_003800 [Haplosporangium sp. Z 11]|nr:hypothetical protein BGZ50_003800 [Haplosporangium sp. Z 11]